VVTRRAAAIPLRVSWVEHRRKIPVAAPRSRRALRPPRWGGKLLVGLGSVDRWTRVCTLTFSGVTGPGPGTVVTFSRADDRG